MSCLKVICWALIIYVALSLHSIRHNYLHNYDVFGIHYKKIIIYTGRRNVLAFDFDDLFVDSQAAQSYPVLLITLYLYINSILKIIRKSCVINLLRYIFI